MFLLPRFFFTDGADAGAAGGVSTTPVDEPNKTIVQPPALSVEDLKELGFDSVDALKELLKKQKEANIPDSEKQKKEQVEKANLIKYATDNDLAKPDDFSKYESLKAKADRDLVFERFATEFREDNPEIAAEDMEASVKEAFETEYKLSAQNQKAKDRGIARLAKEAGEIRNPFETKITTAQQKYNDEKELRAKYPDYEKAYREVMTQATPEKLVLFKAKEGEDEVSVEVVLSAEDKKAIEDKFLKNAKTFYNYSNQKPEDFKKDLTKKISSFIKELKMDEAMASTYEKGKGIGTKSGSNVGANNPFPLAQSGVGSAAPVKDLAKSNESIANARQRAMQDR